MKRTYDSAKISQNGNKVHDSNVSGKPFKEVKDNNYTKIKTTKHIDFEF